MTTEGYHRFSFMFGRGGGGEGYSAATGNFTIRFHYILHTQVRIDSASGIYVFLSDSTFALQIVQDVVETLRTDRPS